MIYFSLPNFIDNFDINTKFKALTLNYIDWLKTEIRVISYFGNIPYSYWNGGINTNRGELLLYPDILYKYSCFSNTPIRFDITNSNLTENDFKDTRLNSILKLCDNGSNLIELNNLKLLNYLLDSNFTYNFIYSNDFCTEDEFINILSTTNNISLYTIPKSVEISPEIIKSFPNSSKIEIPIVNKSCKKYLKCLALENQLQYNFNRASVYDTCEKCLSYNYINYSITIENIINNFLPLGIKHFKLPNMINSEKERIYYKFFLVDYFIKDEFKLKALKYLDEVNK